MKDYEKPILKLQFFKNEAVLTGSGGETAETAENAIIASLNRAGIKPDMETFHFVIKFTE